MAELKTKKTTGSVAQFLDAIPDAARRADCRAIATLMQKATGAKPAMWGPAIVGFGAYHYRYATGREGDWFEIGFSPRKQSLTLYAMTGFERYRALLEKLGTHKSAKGCLYLRSLDDVDRSTLATLLERSVKDLRAGKA